MSLLSIDWHVLLYPRAVAVLIPEWRIQNGKPSQNWLVVEPCLSEKIWTSVGMMTFPVYGKRKHVPHQKPPIIAALEKNHIILIIAKENMMLNIVSSKKSQCPTVRVVLSWDAPTRCCYCLRVASCARQVRQFLRWEFPGISRGYELILISLFDSQACW